MKAMMGESRWRWPRQADQYMATPQGQWALRHGCGLALWEHVAEFGTYPSRNEIQRQYEGVERNRARFEGELVGVIATLATMWKARMKREAELAEQFLVADRNVA